MKYLRIILFLVLAAFVNPISSQSGASQSKAEDPITAEIILERWARAVGGRDRLSAIKNIYTKADYEGTAGSGVVEEWATSDGRRKQENNLTGGHVISVFDGSRGWRSTDGRVREYSPEEIEGARNPAFIASYSHLVPDRLPGRVEYLGEDDARENYILKIKPGGTFYVDKKTFLPTRQEGHLTHTGLTILFKGWREVGGIKIPAQLSLAHTDDDYRATETIKEARVNLLLSARVFGRPAEGPRNYHFKFGRSALRVPIELGNGHIFVRLQINDSEPLWFALDTGASASLIDSNSARRVGLQLSGQSTVVGAGGAVTGSRARNVSIRLAGVELGDRTLETIPLDSLSAIEGRRIDGVLGYDFFHDFVLEIDYSGRYIKLSEPQGYRYRGHGEFIPFNLHSEQPYVHAKLELSEQTQVEGEFVIDTGSSNSLMIAKDFANKCGVLASVKSRIESQSRGVGGDVPTIVGRLQGIQLGRFHINEPITTFPNGEITAPGKAGNIGSKILRRFRVIFDYSRQRMILEPNERFADVDEADMSGTTLVAERPDFKTVTVMRVRPNSPAAEVGLKPQDIIVSIDGKRAGEIGLIGIREMFRQEGRRYQIDIKRGSETLRLLLTPRKLI